MDIEVARTFLTISTVGSFARAAEQLHITQTAVTARIKSLEEQLGRTLFIRNKAGARLTPAGHEFTKYATSLVQIWERARQQVALPPGQRAIVSVGGELSLWNPLLLNWLVCIRKESPDIAIRTQVDLPERLLDKVQTGILDVALMYEPQKRPGLRIEMLLEEKLIAVSTEPDTREVGNAGYVYIDWGPRFSTHHNHAFPHLRDTDMHIGLGPLALRYILAMGGSGYFRARAAKPYLERNRLFRVEGAPEYTYSVFIIISDHADEEVVGIVRDSIVTASSIEYEEWV
ncbi:MAG: LysR family transcriptional regulator [Gammaproteobacteria bacterium]